MPPIWITSQLTFLGLCMVINTSSNATYVINHLLLCHGDVGGQCLFVLWDLGNKMRSTPARSVLGGDLGCNVTSLSIKLTIGINTSYLAFISIFMSLNNI